MAYPDDVTKGSPFGTGTKYAITPQYKRLAAFQGDAVFQAPRRFFLQERSNKQHAWAYSTYLSNYVLNGVIISDSVQAKRQDFPILRSGRYLIPCHGVRNSEG